MPTSPLTTTLEDIFRLHQQKEWYFVRPGGNWGDHLIYAGAEALARRIGINWKDIDYRDFDPGALGNGTAIYLHGGGGFNPWGSKRALTNLSKALSSAVDLVVQGPQTAETQSEELAALFSAIFAEAGSAEVHIFSRDPVTLEFLQAILPSGTNIHLDHDTAFQLTLADLLSLAGLNQMPHGRYRLLVVREDDEQPARPPTSVEKSVTLDPAYFANSFRHWLRIHAYAREIISNRLHSAIAGAIMDKSVTIMAGRYHKNRSIWEFSLSKRGVLWSKDEGNGTERARKQPIYPTWLMRSWKVRRAILRLKGIPLD